MGASLSFRQIDPKSWVAQCPVESFLRYGLEKTVMTSLGAGFINHTPPG